MTEKKLTSRERGKLHEAEIIADGFEEFLKGILRYDPYTGRFYWLVRLAQRNKIGDISGSIQKTSGYRVIRINARNYFAHRLAYVFMTGAFPDGEVDHKDGDRANNAWNNLRVATANDNRRNRKMLPNNTTGFRGVQRTRGKARPFQAIIRDNYNHIYLGSYVTAEEAARAYDEKARELHGEFASLNFPDKHLNTRT